MNQIPALVRVFAYLSLLTVGGGMAAFPEMKMPDRRCPQVAHLPAVDSPVQRGADGPRPKHDDDRLHRTVGGWIARRSRRTDRLFRADRDSSRLSSPGCGRSWRSGRGELPFSRDLRRSPSVSCWPAVSPWQKVQSPERKRPRSPLASC